MHTSFLKPPLDLLLLHARVFWFNFRLPRLTQNKNVDTNSIKNFPFFFCIFLQWKCFHKKHSQISFLSFYVLCIYIVDKSDFIIMPALLFEEEIKRWERKSTTHRGLFRRIRRRSAIIYHFLLAASTERDIVNENLFTSFYYILNNFIRDCMRLFACVNRHSGIEVIL